MGKIQGSHQEWDAIWDKNMEGGQQREIFCQFTRGTPKTIYEFWQKCYFEDLSELIKGKNYTKFLELGAGKGTTSMYLSDSGIEDITMVDLSDAGFKLATENCHREGVKPPKMMVADCEKTGLPDEAYDCIYNIGLLEHFDDPSPTLRETYRLLKPGGMVFMPIVPAQPFSRSIAARMKYHSISIPKHYAKTLLGKNKKSKSDGMVRTTYQADFYLKICKQIGFDNLKCIAYNPYWLVVDETSPNYQKALKDYIETHQKKKQTGNYPLLETPKGTELCLLLYGTK